MKKLILNRTVFLVLFTGIVLGQIPQTMSYQGILKTSGGAVVADGNYQLVFNLYDVSTAGTTLWTETHATVAVSDGVFNVILGSVTAINLSFDKQYWLGVTVGTDSELSPRTKLAASPYSLNAQAVTGSNSTSNTFPDDGSVGVGTTSPNEKLTVEGVISLDEQTTAPGLTSGYGKLYTKSSDGKVYFKSSGGTEYDITATGGGDFTNGGEAGGADRTLGNTDNYDLGFETNNATRLHIRNDGNVGIGTTSPGFLLDVNGALGTTDLTIEKSADTFTIIRMKHAGLTAIDAFNLQVESSGFGQKISFARSDSPYTRYFTIDAANSRVGILTMNPKNTLDVEGSVAIGASYSESSTAPTNGLIVEGNVGVGTTSPNEELTVEGVISLDEQAAHPDSTSGYGKIYVKSEKPYFMTSDGVTFDLTSSGLSGSGSTDYLPKFTGSTTLGNSIIRESSSNIGIGTSADASYKLTVQKSASEVSDLLVLKNTNFGAGYGTRMAMRGKFISTEYDLGRISSIWNSAATGGDMIFETLQSTSPNTVSEAMRLTASGNVGVGTTSPNSTFEVSGSFATSAIRTEAGNYTVTATDYIILASTNAGQTITLPTAVGIAGRRYIIKKTGTPAMSVNIVPATSETIDGSTSLLLMNSYQSVEIISDGANWFKISYSG